MKFVAIVGGCATLALCALFLVPTHHAKPLTHDRVVVSFGTKLN